MTARDLILARLRESTEALPLHALNVHGVSQTAASARLREMAREGIVQSVPVAGKRFTAWKMAQIDLSLPLS